MKIKPIYLQDLLSVARELPKMEGIDHEERVLWHFGKAQWKGVDEYVDYVHKYHKSRPVLKPIQTRRDTISRKVSKYTTGLLKSLRTAYFKLLYYIR